MQEAPFYHDIARAPKGVTCQYRTTADGIRLRVASWKKGNKGTVLLFQGRTEFIEKYGPAIGKFLDMGFNVAAPDWRGQGLSQRLNGRPTMGHVDVFADYQKDVKAFMDYVEEQKFPKPYYVVCHSMGGTIGLRAILEGLDASKVIYSAPMWDIAADGLTRLFIKFYTIYLARFFDENFFVPTTKVRNLSFTQSFKTNTLTSFEEEYRIRYKQLADHPDLEIGGPSMRWLREAFDETKRLENIASPNIPAYAFAGSAEKIVRNNAIKKRMDETPLGKYKEFQGAKHELFIEKPEYTEEMWSEIAEFLAD